MKQDQNTQVCFCDAKKKKKISSKTPKTPSQASPVIECFSLLNFIFL